MRLPGVLAAFGRRRAAERPAAPPIQRLLVTGAAGRVAAILRPRLAERYPEVRLTDRCPVGPLLPGESLVLADLGDAEAVKRAVEGCDAVLHLGAVSTEASVEDLCDANLRGVAHVLDACLQHGVRRLVLASTMHVHGLHPRSRRIRANTLPRPDSVYAVSKLFAEELARLYHAKHGIQVACLRIGAVAESAEKGEPGNWIGPEDMAAVTVAMLEHPDVRCEIVHAVARHRGDPLGQDEVARRFGVRWRQGAPSYRRALRKVGRFFGADPVVRRMRGGAFVKWKVPGIESHAEARPEG